MARILQTNPRFVIPVSPGRQTHREILGEYAGFVTRLVAFIVDLALVVAIIIGISVTADLVQRIFGFYELTITLLNIWAVVSSLIVILGHFIVFWMLIGQTPGLYLMGLRVVRTDGRRVTFGLAVRRLIGYYTSAILFLGYFWVLWDDRRQGWHDKLAGTFVIYAWSFDKDLERG